MKKRKVDSSKVDLTLLPFVTFEERRSLPAKPCFYFVLDSKNVCLYIGQSKNPKQRWSGKTHCLYEDFSKMHGIKIAYLPCQFVDLLYEVEEALIYWYKPEFNYKCFPTTRLTNRESRTLYTFVKFLLQTISLTSEGIKSINAHSKSQVAAQKINEMQAEFQATQRKFNAIQVEFRAMQAEIEAMHKGNCEILDRLESRYSNPAS